MVLQISGMVLAFLTRKVEVRGFSESLEIQLVILITTPLALIILALRLVFSDNLNVVGGSYLLGIAAISCTTLGIIFVPKVSAVFVYQR